MFEFFKDLMFFGQKCCSHTNYKNIRYFEKDGTPMNYFICLDCDYKDHGPVIGPCKGEKGSEDWEGVTYGHESQENRRQRV